MLWLGLHFFSLPLEIFTRADLQGTEKTPLAVVTHQGRQSTILLTNGAAQQTGIEAGMPLNSAYALCHELRVLPRQPEQEGLALERLAAWAYQYTSHVVLLPPQDLLLEIGASLRLFNGLAFLIHQMKSGLADLGYRYHWAIAPTPAAAQLFARVRHNTLCRTEEKLSAQLQKTELHHLPFADKTLRALRGVGLRYIGELFNLPRDGITRRFGKECLHYLDRLIGRLPDPRASYQPPSHYHGHLLLPFPVSHTEALGFALHRLLLELTGFLQANYSGIQQAELTLYHHQGTPTRLLVGLVRPSRDQRHLMHLFKEHLQRLILSDEVLEISLQAQQLIPLDENNQQLFAGAETQQENTAQLLEKLRARLGEENVYGLCLLAEHRPEHAWSICEPYIPCNNTVTLHANRPLWLLKEPQALMCHTGLPHYQGVLKLVHGPERIESGWWDGEDVRRDYYIAQTLTGCRLWIYQNQKGNRTWYLHGVFA